MTRRVKTGGRTRKAKRRNVAEPKQAVAHAVASHSRSSNVDWKEQYDLQSQELAEARRLLSDAVEQQTATSEVLKVISRSTFDLQKVLETLVGAAAQLCDAEMVSVTRSREPGGPQYHVASVGFPADWFEFMQTYPLSPERKTLVGRVLLEGAIIHIPDVMTDPEYHQPTAQRLAGFRTILGVPLLRDGSVIGVFMIARRQPREFSARQIELVTTFADQALIAIENTRLLSELRQRTDDLIESLEQQTASSEVLDVISNSLVDTQPVFDAIVRSGLRLFADAAIVIMLPQGDQAVIGAIADSDPVRADGLKRRSPIPLQREYMHSLAIIDGKTVDVPDVNNPPPALKSGAQNFRAGGFNAVTIVPMMRSGTAIGALSVARVEPGPLSPKQQSVLETFAAQAVIAIENTRLLNELRQRTDDLSQALEYQGATSDVLNVISRSPTQVQPVLDAIVDTAARLCSAEYDFIARYADNALHVVAGLHIDAEHERFLTRGAINIDRGSVIGRVALEKRTIHVPDVLADPEFDRFEWQKAGKQRTVLGVPLMREDTLIGAIILARTSVMPFTEKQIELVTTFADQAVIAIENVRLFDEVQARTDDLSESLRQQTATADVLKVISRSVSDVQPVLDTIVVTAGRLCNAEFSLIFKLKGDSYEMAAANNVEDAFVRYAAANPIRPGRESLIGRTALEGRTIHMPDCLADTEYALVEYQKVGKYRTSLGVPLLREGVTIGVIALMRTTVNPFTDREIELVTTFADQAVIAIENARLFNEVQARTNDLTESLQQQTATADVLKVISRSTFDLRTVLQTLVESAARLCEADQGTIAQSAGDKVFHRTATFGFSSEFTEYVRSMPVTPERGSATGRALLESRTVHIPDIDADPDYTFHDAKRLGGFRAILAVPMLREGDAIGVLVLTRLEPRPFTEKQIELVSTFADQAAIAIENVRLFDSVQARTRELAKSLEDLRTAQDRLIQTEKLASLGQLTAGIAHEIKNPLNFVNNFSAVSVELIDELRQALSSAHLDSKLRAEIGEIADMLQGNLDKVVQHGKRADSIVKNMLLHSRQGSGEHRPVNVNNLVEESLNLAYHGARAENQNFNISLERSFDPAAGEVDVFPQEITRVLLNLISNGFYAATKRQEQGARDHEPTLSASTKNLDDRVEIRIRDNGTGIPPEIKEKMFNPFFTTKPAGEGTGLGLSLSHDIVVKQHAGSIDVDTQPGEYTEFRVILPRRAATIAKSGGHS